METAWPLPEWVATGDMQACMSAGSGMIRCGTGTLHPVLCCAASAITSSFITLVLVPLLLSVILRNEEADLAPERVSGRRHDGQRHGAVRLHSTASQEERS